MRQMDKFIFRFHPYAVDRSVIRWDSKWGYVEAVWFRRKRGTVSAHIGELRNMPRQVTADPVVFLSELTDGQHNVACYGRWDGRQYSGSSRSEVEDSHMAILRPMLASFHADSADPWVPDRFGQWWTFRPVKVRQ